MTRYYFASRYSRHPEMRTYRTLLMGAVPDAVVTSRWIDCHSDTLEQSYTPEALNADPDGPAVHVRHPANRRCRRPGEHLPLRPRHRVVPRLHVVPSGREGAGIVTASVTISQAVPASLWLTANGRLHWTQKAQRTKVLRFHARVLALDAIKTEGVKLHRTDVLATISYPTRRRQDPANAAPTVKAMIDGCVDAGLLPDDDADHLGVLSFVRGEPTGKPGWYRVDLTFEGEPA